METILAHSEIIVAILAYIIVRLAQLFSHSKQALEILARSIEEANARMVKNGVAGQEREASAGVVDVIRDAVAKVDPKKAATGALGTVVKVLVPAVVRNLFGR